MRLRYSAALAGSSVTQAASGVRTTPGATALTRIPYGARSRAAERTKAMTPPLEAQRVRGPGGLLTVDVEDDDRGALRREPFRDGAPDTLRGARDERHFAREPVHAPTLPAVMIHPHRSAHVPAACHSGRSKPSCTRSRLRS